MNNIRLKSAHVFGLNLFLSFEKWIQLFLSLKYSSVIILRQHQSKWTANLTLEYLQIVFWILYFLRGIRKNQEETNKYAHQVKNIKTERETRMNKRNQQSTNGKRHKWDNDFLKKGDSYNHTKRIWILTTELYWNHFPLFMTMKKSFVFFYVVI